MEGNSISLRRIYAEGAVASADTESRTVSGLTFSSTAPARRFGRLPPGLGGDWGEFDEILSHDPSHWRLQRVANGVCSYLLNHDRFHPLGVVESVVIDPVAGKAVATVRLSRSEIASQHLQDIADRTAGGISFGYLVHKYQLVSRGDDSTPPMLIATDIELLEISNERVPHDPDANFSNVTLSARSIEIPSHLKEKRMEEFNDREKMANLEATIEELKRSLSQADTENSQLREQLQYHTKVKELEARAKSLASEGRITHHEMGVLFGGDVNVIGVEYFLEIAEKRSPILNTKNPLAGKEVELPTIPDDPTEGYFSRKSLRRV